MFLELLMKKNGKLLFGVFVVLFIAAVSVGAVFIFNNLNTVSSTFDKDGYALYISSNKEAKASTYPFSSGTNYTYNKKNDKISFVSENDNVAIDEDTIIHYSDNSLGLLKKGVGIDANDIDKDLIFYYNIFKNTSVEYSKDGYKVDIVGDNDVTFKNLLLRISENKFLLSGNSVRLVLNNDEVVDFGTYAEFEYTSGSVVKIYNNDKFFQTIASKAVLLVDNVKIDLNTTEIYKDNVKYITLSNLVIDNNGNIDTLTIDKENLDISDGNVDIPENEGGSTNSGSNGGSNTGGGLGNDSVGGSNNEVVEDTSITKKTPVYKVSELVLTSLKVDAKIDIVDEDALINGATTVKILENATAKAVYETSGEMGDTSIYVSYADLKPDTEYLLTANASYKIDDIEYNKTFISKIFRTDALGVSFNKSYATETSLVLEVVKENYSKVNSLALEIYDESGSQVNYVTVTFSNNLRQEIIFNNLEPDTNYLVSMSEILCQGVVVDDGFSQKENIKTLKTKPVIGDLTYDIDKRNAKFNLNVSNIEDLNYGIENYRYEIYDARMDISTSAPVLTLSQKNLATMQVNVDDVKINRGAAYTYKLVVEFYDNEKIVEYSKELGTTMTLDGVAYPTVRFDEESSRITWEQINGTIVVEDPSGAIVSDKYQVIYKNSVDVYNVETITADSETGNIPITVNNLRANETYTFQVYASLNMQDGNDVLESAYIGSVFIQTKKPNSLTAVFASTNNYSDAFSLNFMLQDTDGQDASLEASTLSEFTLTLYQGSTVEGTKQIYRRVLDTNDDDYVSTLKRDFYDANAIVNPDFFDSKNADYTEKVYTIEISNAYDYTDYKNEIPIIDNVFTFQTNSYIPDLPLDYNDAAIVSTITNRNSASYGVEYDNRLESNITVGYALVPKFNNEAKNAEYIIWHVWKKDITTGEFVMLNLDQTIEFKDDGTIPQAIYLLQDGTSFSVDDTDALRRGNTYYFSYEIFMDVNKDGTIDTEYPKKYGEDIILTSKTLYPSKQSSTIKLYPSTSGNKTYTWKYKITDIDNTLEEKKLYSYVDGVVNPTSSPDVVVDTEEYQTVTFTGLTVNKNMFIKKYERLRKEEDAKYTNLAQQYFENPVSDINLNYSVAIDVNKMIITIDDYENKKDIINSIASVDVVVTPKKQEDIDKYGTKTISNLKIDGETIIIDFFELYEYLSVDIVVDLVVYYDNGIMGFDGTAEYYAMQQALITSDNVYYIYDSKSKSLYQNSVVTNSMFTSIFDPLNEKLTLTTKDAVAIDIPIEINSTGVVYDGNNIMLKGLKQQALSSTNNEVRFDLIIPGISMLDTSNRLNVKALLDSVEIGPKIINLETVLIKDNLIYIDLYQTDENGTNAQFLKTYSETIPNLDNPLEIKNLTPETNYYVQFYAYVYDESTSSYVKKYLYDIDQQADAVKYRFYTLASVGISNITAEMIEHSYTNKYINIKYNLDTIYGFDHIEYVLYKVENSKYIETDIEISDSIAFFASMSVPITATPGLHDEIEYGGTYAIRIRPVGYYESNGENIEIDLGTVVHEFTLPEPEQPHIGITSSKDATSISFRVSIYDTDYIIKNGKYSVKLVDSNYNTLATFNNQSISYLNKIFKFEQSDYGFVNRALYKFVVTVELDNDNTASNYMMHSVEKTITFGDYVNLGTVTTSKNVDVSTDIDIIFADSYKLNTINTVLYTVTDSSGEFYLSNRTEFNTRYDSNKDLYYYTISITDVDKFEPDSLYTITMNFYTGNTMVDQAELSYYYTLGGDTGEEIE